MFKDRNIIRYGTIKYIGLFRCGFRSRLSRQGQPEPFRRSPSRSAHRLQVRRRVSRIRSVVLDYQGPKAVRLLAWLRTAHRRLFHLPDRWFALLAL